MSETKRCETCGIHKGRRPSAPAPPASGEQQQTPWTMRQWNDAAKRVSRLYAADSDAAGNLLHNIAEAHARSRVEQWVAVEERLPDEDHENVIVAVNGKPYASAWMESGDPVCDCDELPCDHATPRFWISGEEQLENVTHWQPLPAPPAVKP